MPDREPLRSRLWARPDGVQQVHVPPYAGHQRLDAFLTRAVGGRSRSEWQRLIGLGAVTVEGRRRKPGDRVEPGQRIEVRSAPAHVTLRPAATIPLTVLYEDPSMIVVDKPPGLVVHPAPGHQEGTLVNALLGRFPELQDPTGEQRPGIVHRLDKDTSGLIVIGRSARAMAALQEQFRLRTATKRYLLLVLGDLGDEVAAIEAPIGRDRSDRKRMAAQTTGRESRTEFAVLERFGQYTLLEATLRSGRTHQLRVHFQFIGHPVAGDRTYGSGKGPPGLRRQFVHAAYLKLRSPEGEEELEFRAPLPRDLTEPLEGLRAPRMARTHDGPAAGRVHRRNDEGRQWCAEEIQMSAALSPARARIAPSPTGDPHVGTAYTALFNLAYARKTSGRFVLRIEDTDRVRFVPESERLIFDSLRWLGLEWDEGPDVGGPYAPYRQSERLGRYREHAEGLIAAGHGYRCWCSSERLERARKAMEARKEPPKYDRLCLGKSEQQRRALGETSDRPVVRMLVPNDGVTAFDDVIRGRIEFENRLLDDQVLLKSDGFPTYHLAVVVDDHDMDINLVMRGEEWISSTPKHVLLYDWFGWELPRFVHLPLLRNENRSKVSKRRNPWATLPWFRENGYLPEALLNFLALLGWSMPDGREIFGFGDIVEHFSLDRISLTGPIFNLEKLDWLNGHYIRDLPLETLAERVRPFLERAGLSAEDGPALAVTLPLIQERLKRLAEAPDLLRFFYERRGQYDPALLVPKGLDPRSAHAALLAAIERVRAVDDFSHERLETELRDLAADRGLKTGQLFMLLRVACTYSTVSPPLFETMAALGRERTLERLTDAEQKLASLRA